MIKRIEPNNNIFNSEEFKKDKYEFSILIKNLPSKTLELYSDEENYVLCRGGLEWPTWIWTKNNLDASLIPEIEEGINLYRLDRDTRYTCKRELYELLKKDNFEGLGDYYMEMGYLECDKTIPPKQTDGYLDKATLEDKDVLIKFIYNEHKEIGDIKELTFEEAETNFVKRIEDGNYYVWKNSEGKIVAQANYSIQDGSAKIAGVYTEPDARGKGYAANLIYQLTNKVLAEGHKVSLYTDYGYIPSNKAYKNVGYVDKDVLINFSCQKVKNKAI